MLEMEVFNEHSLPKQNRVAWELLKLLELSGTLEPQRVYATLANRFGLTPKQKDLSVGTVRKENAWENRCRFARRRLVSLGFMSKGPKGRWSLTPKGVEIAKSGDSTVVAQDVV